VQCHGRCWSTSALLLVVWLLFTVSPLFCNHCYFSLLALCCGVINVLAPSTTNFTFSCYWVVLYISSCCYYSLHYIGCCQCLHNPSLISPPFALLHTSPPSHSTTPFVALQCNDAASIAPSCHCYRWIDCFCYQAVANNDWHNCLLFEDNNFCKRYQAYAYLTQSRSYRADKHVSHYCTLLVILSFCSTILALHQYAHVPSIHRGTGLTSGHCQSKMGQSSCNSCTWYCRSYWTYLGLCNGFQLQCIENMKNLFCNPSNVMWRQMLYTWENVTVYKFIESRESRGSNQNVSTSASFMITSEP